MGARRRQGIGSPDSVRAVGAPGGDEDHYLYRLLQAGELVRQVSQVGGSGEGRERFQEWSLLGPLREGQVVNGVPISHPEGKGGQCGRLNRAARRRPGASIERSGCTALLHSYGSIRDRLDLVRHLQHPVLKLTSITEEVEPQRDGLGSVLQGVRNGVERGGIEDRIGHGRRVAHAGRGSEIQAEA